VAVVGDRARERLIDDPLDMVALAARANDGASSAPVSAGVLDEWLATNGPAERERTVGCG
jgi:hypothetical protein